MVHVQITPELETCQIRENPLCASTVSGRLRLVGQQFYTQYQQGYSLQYQNRMRPKVSRGIKSTQSTKNLAILGNKPHKPSDSFLIEELDLGRLNTKEETSAALHTYRTDASFRNYTSRTNQTEKKPLQTVQFPDNRRTYAEIQKEKNLTRKSYLSRHGSQSGLFTMEDQQNKYQKQVPRESSEMNSIDIEILKILQQENIMCKQTISQLRKELEQVQLSHQFLRKTNDDLEKKIFETQRQFLWLQDTLRKKEGEIAQKSTQLEATVKEIEQLRLQLENTQRKDVVRHNRKVSFQQTEECEKLKEQNESMKRQQETFKNELRNIRKENVEYRRQIAKLKRELIERQENWIQMGERSSIRIAQGIKLQLKEFGEERLRQYQQMVKHYREEVEFLREKNKVLQGKLQTVKQKQIKDLINLKKSFDEPMQKRIQRSESAADARTHIKSRSLAMLPPFVFNTEESNY